MPVKYKFVVETGKSAPADIITSAESGVSGAAHVWRGRKFSRALTFLIVGAIHVIIWHVFAHMSIRQLVAQQRVDPIEARFFDLPAVSVPIKEPAIVASEIEFSISAPLPISIEDPSGIHSLELPHLDSTGMPELASYSARADLPPGQIATVVVVVEKADDGNVISAEVVRSTGNDSTNEAAKSYARDTKWIPGMVLGVPRAMKASLTVILGSTERLVTR